ncbi:MAG: ShlB/FhaC/HecB family hemolysin secretion/activation protein [Chlorobiaceae bacterium]|nr:ShlB/FhaC/HecB family hemolysin secretion/activation protein [Chlorobiaceae bacterium]
MFFLCRKLFPGMILWSYLLFPVLNSPLYGAQPDAGQLLREQQPQRQLPQRTILPEKEREKEFRASGAGVKILVKSYRFTGFESLVQESELQKLLADTIGKELNYDELKGQLVRIDNYLKKNGWILAESYLSEQDVNSGLIEIRLSRSVSDGNMVFNRNKRVRLCPGVLSGIGSDAVQSGQAINERKLERSLLLINDLPGMSANALLDYGAVQGAKKVVVDVAEGSLLTGAVWEDNYGNYFTGRQRSSAMVNINDATGCGDQLSIIGTLSDGLRIGKLYYAYPLGSNGLKANISYSQMSYKMLRELSELHVKGQGQIFDAGLSYPLVRSRLSNVTASGLFEYKSLSDTILGVDISDTSVNSYTLGLKGDFFDQFLGEGYNTWNLSVTGGTVNEGVADLSLSGSQGGFDYAKMGLNRLQSISRQVNLNLSWSAQFASGNLHSSEKFCLGGPYGVRAYPIGEASGDAGHLFNVDLRFKLPVPAEYGTVQLSGFYDAGRITTHVNPWPYSILTATGKNQYWLQGFGVEVQYIYSGRLNLKGTWAHVIGENPGRNFWGNNSELKSDSDRFWLVATLFF